MQRTPHHSSRSMMQRLAIVSPIVAVIAGAAWSGTATASEMVTLTLHPAADATVYNTGTADDGGTLIAAHSQANGEYAKVYLRYILPNDLGTSLEASFAVTRTTAGAWDFEYRLFGLNDGHAGEAWTENTLDWATAPANLTEDAWRFDGGATELGAFQVNGASHGGIAPDLYGHASASLRSFLGQDTEAGSH